MPLITILIFLLIHLNLVKPELNTNTDNTDPLTGFQRQNSGKGVDADAVILQRRTLGTTTYHLLDDANGHPIFTRPVQDGGKKFICFNNPSFPQGSGHYIILRRMEGQSKHGFGSKPGSQTGNPVNRMPQFIYEVFTLSFK